MSRVVTYVEIDVDRCSLSFGEGACPATGDKKCYNSFGTCPVRTSMVIEPVTLILSEPTEDDDMNIDAIPCVKSVSLQSGKISLGEDLGIRSGVTITADDFRWSDTGVLGDKYRSSRGVDPWVTGTFWGKFRSRNPYVQGRNLRIVRGELGAPRDRMDIRHYTINNIVGPDAKGSVTINGQDTLKFADGDRAQAPRPTSGSIISDLNTTETKVVMTPYGIGDLEYPASGLVAIGGSEICLFTRVGDELTLVRGQRGTRPEDHKSSDRVQLVLEYAGVSPANIINDLLVNYADVSQSTIPLQDWRDEVDSFLRRLYSRTIAEPTSVRELVSELIHQAALAVWHDDVSSLIRLQVLKPTPANSGVLNEDIYTQGKANVQDQPKKRVSTCQVMYGLKNPLMASDKAESYRSRVVVSDIQGQADYGTPAIEVIFGTWIPAYAKQVAERLGSIRVGRFAKAPKRVTLEVHKMAPLIPELGGAYYFRSWCLQDADGLPETIPAQVISRQDMDDRVLVELEEATFIPIDEEDLLNRVVTIDGNAMNINLRQIHDTIYPDPSTSDSITFIIPRGVTVGSNSASIPALDVGQWPSNIVPSLHIHGRVQGAGGRGGNGTSGGGNSGAGGRGGDAIFARNPLVIETSNEIWSGGGGGGGGTGKKYSSGGGGGGQGFVGGDGGGSNIGRYGQAGSATNPGGATAQSGRGGYAGQAGVWGRTGGSGYDSTPPGQPGSAIDGDSFITFTGSHGDIRGPRIN